LICYVKAQQEDGAQGYYLCRKPHIEIHIYEKPDGSLKLHITNWERGKVTTFEENKEQGHDQKHNLSSLRSSKKV